MFHCYVCALSNVPICCLIETPGAEPPLSPTEDEPLSTDPANWPSPLTQRIRTELVRRGPSKLPPNFVFHKNESDGRSCHQQYFKKTLVCGEKMARSWLMYSMENNSLFCFCCKLFSKRIINLTTSGMGNWKHASAYLTSSEGVSPGAQLHVEPPLHLGIYCPLKGDVRLGGFQCLWLLWNI